MQDARFPPAMLEEDPMSPQRHLTLPCPVLRQQQQREDGAFNQPSPATAASYSATAPPGSFNTLNRADETTHELYVVFNVVQEDGNVASKHDQKKGKHPLECSNVTASPWGSMEVANSSEANDNFATKFIWIQALHYGR